MLINRRIKMIQLRGSMLDNGIISLPNDKHLVWAMVLLDDKYHVTESVLDDYIAKCYYEDIKEFESEYQARVFILNLGMTPNY